MQSFKTRNSSEAGSGISPEDVIVFMDAYDVLVFPHIRTIANSFSNSFTASIKNIHFCSEYASYPELSSGWGYKRNIQPLGNHNEADYLLNNVLHSKYLNSGCFIGTADMVSIIVNYFITNIDHV